MRKQVITILVGAAGLCVTMGLTACQGSGGTTVAKAATVPTAQVAVAKRGNISQMLTLAGQFQPYQVVDVHPKVSGYMIHIYVDIGDIVHKGETIAKLEVPELKAKLRQSIFMVQQSQQEIDRAQREISRAEATHEALHLEYVRLKQAAEVPGLIAQQELDDAQAKDLSSAAQVDAAKAALAAAQQHLEAARANNDYYAALEGYTTVTAPLDGVVVWRFADTGALIQGGTNSNTKDLPIVRIAQSGLLRLRVPVPEDDIHYVHKGTVMNVRVGAINSLFKGKVVRFTRNVDFETRAMETEIDVWNPKLTIDPGMYADVLMQLGQAKNTVTIPVTAVVLNNSNQNTVYVLDHDNRVHIRPVDVGIEGNLLAQIKSGLQPGERVILGGQGGYQPGEEVAPEVAKTVASETHDVTGGTIDLEANNTGANQ